MKRQKVMYYMKLYICLLISYSLIGMEQPPVAVTSMDGRHTWHLGKDVVAQMVTLHDQNKDCGSNHVFLPPAVDHENFTALLPLLNSKERDVKIILKAQNTTQLAQIARDADCLGAQKLLARSLRLLEKRVSNGQSLDLPDTLQSELVKNVVKRDAYIASLLFKIVNHSQEYLKQEEIRICGTENGAIVIDTKQGRKLINLNGTNLQHQPDFSHIIPAPVIKKSVIFNDNEIFLVNDEEQRVIQKWYVYTCPMVLVPYDQGVFAILTCGNVNDCHVVNYRVGAEFTDFKPFETCPTAIALSHDQAKLVVGSYTGQVALYNAQTLARESEVLEPGKGVNNYRQVCALAIDPKNSYIASARHIGTVGCELGVYNLKKKAYDELIPNANYIDDICFDKTRPLLYAIDLGRLTIWNIKDKKILHTINAAGYDGPFGCKLSSLLVDDAGAVCTVYGGYADQKATINLFDVNIMHELAHCSLPAIAFLMRVSKKIVDGQQVTSADEPDFKTLYHLLPKSLQQVIAKHMGWRYWLWL